MMQVFSSCLRSSGRTGIIASEEEDIPVAVEESYSGNYIVVFDPLDGSSNIDAAVSTGSIWGIYRPNEECLTNLGENPTVSASPQLGIEYTPTTSGEASLQDRNHEALYVQCLAAVSEMSSMPAKCQIPASHNCS